MSYSGNSSADALYERRVIGRRCEMCGGRGKVSISSWSEWKEILRNYDYNFRALLAFGREFSKEGEMECPECHGDGRKYG